MVVCYLAMAFNKTLLILGTGLDQVPGIKKAKELGLYTIGLDINPNTPGVKLVDEFYKVNVKDIDEVSAFVSNYKDKKIDAAIAFGVDIPHILAKVAKILNIPYYTNYELASISQNKYLAKEQLKKFNVKIPPYKKVEDFSMLKEAISEFGFPCVLKPVDNCGSRGVLRLTKDTDLKWAYNFSKSYSKIGELILEKFLDGPQISSESIIINGNVYTIGLSHRNYEYLERFSPFIIENGGDLPPSFLSDSIKKAIDVEIEKAAQAFGVNKGIIKGDIVIHNQEVYIIEIALRLSGGHFSSIEIPLNTGVDFLKYAILLAIDDTIDTTELAYKSINYVALRYIFPYRSGTIKELSFPSFVTQHPLIHSYGLYYKVGDKASYPVKNHTERLGYFILSSNSRNSIKTAIKDIYNNIKLTIQ